MEIEGKKAHFFNEIWGPSQNRHYSNTFLILSLNSDESWLLPIVSSVVYHFQHDWRRTEIICRCWNRGKKWFIGGWNEQDDSCAEALGKKKRGLGGDSNRTWSSEFASIQNSNKRD